MKRPRIRTKVPRDVLKWSEKRMTALLDTIKDEIDTLHEIKSPKRRIEAARDLVDYITLHHLEGC